MKKILSILLVMVMLLALAGCATTPASTTTAAPGTTTAGTTTAPREAHKIGIGLYSDSGPAVTSLKAFLDSIKGDLNVEYVFTTLSSQDEAVNKTKVQEMISAGCEALILTMDSAMESILAECKKAGVPVAGFLSDFNNSFETIKDDPTFLGTVCDGPFDQTSEAVSDAENMIAAGLKSIGVIKFPAFAFPLQIGLDNAFRATIAKYNETAAAADKIVIKDTVDLMFQPLASAYLDANADIDGIYGLCAGTDFIYPTLVAAGKTNIKLYTRGMTDQADVLDNFGTKGNGCIQTLSFSNAEAIAFPLVLLLNQLDGKTFADQPAGAQRADSSKVILTNDSEMETAKTKMNILTGKASDLLLTGQQVLDLLAVNGGTFAELVETVNSMSIEDIAAR